MLSGEVFGRLKYYAGFITVSKLGRFRGSLYIPTRVSGSFIYKLLPHLKVRPVQVMQSI